MLNQHWVGVLYYLERAFNQSIQVCMPFEQIVCIMYMGSHHMYMNVTRYDWAA